MELHALVSFLSEVERPDFKAGDVAPSREEAPGVWTMPYVRYSDTVEKLVQAAYDHGLVLRDFDWAKWASTKVARSLRDDEATLAAATPEQLARLLTVLIRQDRFAEGTLLDAFESGLILRILRRAAKLCEDRPDP
jgi:hypothetical protein